jgi:acetylornithine deacetylase/succinyl-diaminopimelate desuccinylase-like protein
MSQAAKDRILAALVPDEIVDLAKALVRIPSYTTDETPVARFLDQLFRREGLESLLQEVDPGASRCWRGFPAPAAGAASCSTGTSTRDPWTPTIEGDRFYGAGIFNMKAGVASSTRSSSR